MRLWRCRACKINQKTKRAPFLDLFKRESPGTRGQARAHRRDTRKGDKQRKGKSQRGRRRAARQTRRACFEEKQRRTVEPKGNVNSKGKAQLAAGARRTASGFGFDCLLSDTEIKGITWADPAPAAAQTGTSSRAPAHCSQFAAGLFRFGPAALGLAGLGGWLMAAAVMWMFCAYAGCAYCGIPYGSAAYIVVGAAAK